MSFDDEDESRPNETRNGKEVSTVKSSTALTPARAPASGGLAGYIAEATAGEIAGTLLKYSKGDYFAGKENLPVPLGTRLIANIDSLSIGQIKWLAGKVFEVIMGRVSDDFRPPQRHQLGDRDESLWERDENGKPKDPWHWTIRMEFANPESGEVYTFSTSSSGGRKAIDELCKAFLKAQPMHPNEWPIVGLSSDSYAHPNKTYGRVKFPVFKIVGWVAKDVVSLDPQSGPAQPAPAKNPLADEPPPANEDDYGFDDSEAPPF